MEILQKTVPDLLAKQIRDEIIRGNYQPGERLRLRDLADRYNISTMPVREALKTLEIEGLVVGEPRKGVRVTQLTTAELEDIYDMRVTLEAMAARLAVPHISAETIDELSEIIVQIDNAQGDPVKIVELNTKFHTLLYAASERKHLCSVISTLRTRVAHYFRAYMSEIGTYAQEDHQAILVACRNRDAERAAAIMHEHIARAGRAVVASHKLLESEE